jgi:hypothetical protein
MPLPSMPLAPVIVLLSGGLGQDVTLDRGTAAAAGSAGRQEGNSLSGNPGAAQLAFVVLGGDDQKDREPEAAEAAQGGPSPADALRNLRPFRPLEDRPAAPAEDEERVSFPHKPAEEADTDLVWQDLSWPDWLRPSRPDAPLPDSSVHLLAVRSSKSSDRSAVAGVVEAVQVQADEKPWLSGSAGKEELAALERPTEEPQPTWRDWMADLAQHSLAVLAGLALLGPRQLTRGRLQCSATSATMQRRVRALTAASPFLAGDQRGVSTQVEESRAGVTERQKRG